MVGYNHYADCSCGWCANRRQSPIVGSSYKNHFKQANAQKLLKINNATTYSTCFIDSNAKCPVCGAPVFFYKNAEGSKVYFDELGPPWPKHPCTSSHKSLSSNLKEGQRPLKRSIGQIEELIEAAQKTGRFQSVVYGTRSDDVWEIVIVNTVHFDGYNLKVKGNYVNSKSNEKYNFKIKSSQKLLKSRDIVTVKKNKISFIHPVSLTPVTIQSGDEISDVKNLKKNKEDGFRVISREKVNITKNQQKEYTLPNVTISMISKEILHFSNSKVKLRDFVQRFAKIINQFSNEGTVRAENVLIRLNFHKKLTAQNKPWTLNLVFILLALINYPQLISSYEQAKGKQ